MEYEPDRPKNKKFLTTEISVALIGGLAILIAAMISVWGTLTAAQVPIFATQTAEARLTQIALAILTPYTATPVAPSKIPTLVSTAPSTIVPIVSSTGTPTSIPKSTDTPRPTATFTPNFTDTPRSMVTVTLVPRLGSTEISSIDGAIMIIYSKRVRI